MEHIFAIACLYRWDLPLSALWVCDPALKGGCCFLQQALGVCCWQQQSGAAGGQVCGKKEAASRRGFSKWSRGFCEGEIWGAGCRSRRLSSKQGTSEAALQLEQTPTSATFAETNMRSLCRDLCVWRCFFPPSKFDH